MSCHCYARLQRLTRRFGNRYGVDMKLEDSLAAALVDQNPGGTKTPMGSELAFLYIVVCQLTLVTAENLAKKYGISREECDCKLNSVDYVPKE